MTMQTLALNTLILSKLNVRTTERDADIEALAEDIAQRGLKQNLVVIPAHFMTGETDAGWEDKWEVIAGGRRFQAMQWLVNEGRLPADHPVACLLEERVDASETSLSENLHKVAMNPADEFAAFKAIIDQRMGSKHGESEATAIAYTAKRFGATVRHVEGRLRLATLAPEILDALRANTIGIEAAKAYAATTDHDLQRRVFADHQKTYWKAHNPKQVREDIRGRTLPLDHPLALFVGLVTYQAEGGRIEAEMFMGSEGQQRLVDVPLLEKLARKIAEAAIPALAKAAGLKEGLYAPGIGWQAKWPKAPTGYVKNWGNTDGLAKAKLKKLIGIYALDTDPEDGTVKLLLSGTYKPEEASKNAETERDWQAEHDQRNREYQITKRAAQLALPKFAGTPLEGKLFHPEYGRRIEECDGDHSYVTLWVKVANADIDTQREEAIRQIDAEATAEAAAETERVAALAEEFPDYVKPISEDQDEGTDELTSDEVDA